eukprot:7226841-Prymnesium_polylepis.1
MAQTTLCRAHKRILEAICSKLVPHGCQAEDKAQQRQVDRGDSAHGPPVYACGVQVHLVHGSDAAKRNMKDDHGLQTRKHAEADIEHGQVVDRCPFRALGKELRGGVLQNNRSEQHRGAEGDPWGHLGGVKEEGAKRDHSDGNAGEYYRAPVVMRGSLQVHHDPKLRPGAVRAARRAV